MKKLMFAALAMAAFTTFAEEAKEAKVEKQEAPLFTVYANYGVYSGYQLYGNLLNDEPTLQSYAEINFNLPKDIGYIGLGLWHNSDLTGRRSYSLRRAFNEFDPNIHFGHTFWFDDDKTVGLDYRTTVVWYWYPHSRRNIYTGDYTHTTMDWNHSFALLNPILIPFADVVHEYHESNGNLVQFGVKKPFQVCDNFSLEPSLVFVWRDERYTWCFPTAFGGMQHDAGLATVKVELDATWAITQNFGLFGKFAWCSTIDGRLRDNVDEQGHDSYGLQKDFIWGGVGVYVAF